MRSSASTLSARLGFCFTADSRASFAAACCASTSTWGSRFVDGRLLLLSPIDFLAVDGADMAVVVVAAFLPGKDLSVAAAREALVAGFVFETGGLVPRAAAARFIEFALPVGAATVFFPAFGAAGFLLVAAGDFAAAPLVMAPCAAGLMAEEGKGELPRCLDAVAIEVSGAGA